MKVGMLDYIMEIENEQELDLLDGLNDTQRAVVSHASGPAIVCSVAGSGKTETVTRFVAKKIREGTNPEKICATTFTKKAAGEMNERAERRFGVKGVQISTFHSLCLQILRKDSPWRAFEVDSKDRMRLALKNILGYQQMNWKGVDITDVQQFIGTCKNGLIVPEDFPRSLPTWFTNKYNVQQRHPWQFDLRYAETYFRYEEEREIRKLITYDDMLCLSVRWLQENQLARSYWANRYEYVIVDEFQDSNRTQYELMRILAENAKVLLVVGDDDQLIYQWRGSIPEFTTGFEKTFGAKTFHMDSNYRSTPEILDVANAIIKNNTKRIVKVNRPTRGDVGAPVVFTMAEDMDAEAEHVAEAITELREDGVKWGDCAVLYRVNAQSRPFEEVFISRKIPHVIIGGVDFYKRKEVVDILSYLRVAVDEGDDDACARARSTGLSGMLGRPHWRA